MSLKSWALHMSTVEGEQDRSVRPGRAWEGELGELPASKRDAQGVRSANTEGQRRLPQVCQLSAAV